MISILHPSRQRPNKSLQTISNWLDRSSSTTQLELIVSLDADDPKLDVYKTIYSGVACNLIVNNNRSAVDAINAAAKESTGNILIVVSDDTDCPVSWDQHIINATKDREDWILKVYDGIQRYLITMPIMDRKYYQRFDYIYFQEYKHMFCDTEITHVADLLDKIIWRNDLVFKHKHYSGVRGMKADEVNVRADATWEDGKRIYLQRVRNKFGLDVPDVMKISSYGHDHIKWLRQNMRK